MLYSYDCFVFTMCLVFFRCRLRITSVTVKDGASYTCEAFNRYGTRSTNGWLIILAGMSLLETAMWSLAAINSNLIYYK